MLRDSGLREQSSAVLALQPRLVVCRCFVLYLDLFLYRNLLRSGRKLASLLFDWFLFRFYWPCGHISNGYFDLRRCAHWNLLRSRLWRRDSGRLVAQFLSALFAVADQLRRWIALLAEWTGDICHCKLVWRILLAHFCVAFCVCRTIVTPKMDFAPRSNHHACAYAPSRTQPEKFITVRK